MIYQGIFDFFATDFIIEVQIYDDEETLERVKQTTGFWTNSERVVEHFDGDHRKAFVAYLAQEIHTRQEKYYGAESIQRRFSWEDGHGVEGFPALDGSEGVRLLSCISDQVDPTDLEIEVRDE